MDIAYANHSVDGECDPTMSDGDFRELVSADISKPLSTLEFLKVPNTSE